MKYLAQLVQDKPDMVVIITIMHSLHYVFFSIFSKENTLDLSFYNTTKQYEFQSDVERILKQNFYLENIWISSEARKYFSYVFHLKTAILKSIYIPCF